MRTDLRSVSRQFGYDIREVPKGFFLAPITKNRFGHVHIGSDQMLVKHTGEIVVYEHDAQAFLAATAIKHRLTAEEGERCQL
jgi:hypothetical protein